jgi:CRISPR/Cas system endoribonuclease Cas6 (RAMP superfamily)
MSRVVFVDTAIPADKKKMKKHKTHVVFDGNRVFRVKKLTELEDAGEIFIDALFPELYNEVLEVLKKGARVYLLKDTTKLKKVRMKSNVEKGDENDAMLLAQIPREKFKPLTIEELELKTRMGPLINKYKHITRWKKH